MPLFHRSRDTSGGPAPRPDETRSAALEAALRVGELAAGGASLGEAVTGIVRIAIDLLKAEQGSLMLLDEDGRTLVLVSSEGVPIPAPLGATLRVGDSVAGRVVVTGRPLRLDEVERDEFVNFIPKARPISSSVVVPLRAAGTSIGVLCLALSERAQRFTDDDLRLAQLFADQAAGLIHRTRLHEQSERRSRDMTELAESSRLLVGELDLDVVLQRILDGGVRLARSNRGFTCLVEPETRRILRGAFRGFEKKTITLIAGSPEIVAATGSDDAILFAVEGVGRLVAVGIGRAGDALGVLVAAAETDAGHERFDLLRTFAGQCVSALSAAGLHTQVQRKESELTSIIHGVPSPIVLVDEGNKIVAINVAAEQLFGTFDSFVAGSDALEALANAPLVALISGRGDITGEVSAGSPPRLYKVRVRDVRVPGAPLGRVAIMDDVSAEREMAQTQRDFVSMIGHELRTPLTIIKGYSRSVLRNPQDLAHPVREAFTTIDARAGQLERLIEDLLCLSGIEACETIVRGEQVHVRELIEDVVAQLAPSHRGRRVVLRVPRDLEWLLDETKVTLVLRHLIDNALKYSEPPEPVVVHARADSGEDELRIDVIDRGIGILSSEIGDIFERFHQVDSSSTRRHGGTGVGLYLSRGLVRAHGGRIWVDSTWGKGSTFSLALPGASASAASARRHTETA